jgi:hypothetical protein
MVDLTGFSPSTHIHPAWAAVAPESSDAAARSQPTSLNRKIDDSVTTMLVRPSCSRQGKQECTGITGY